MVSVGIDKLWKYPIGTIVYIDSRKYMYIGKSELDNMAMLYSYDSYIVVYEDDLYDDEDEDINVIITDDKVDLDELIKVKSNQALVLISEGWTDTASKSGLNLTNELEELQMIIKLKNIVNCRDVVIGN